MGWKACAGEGGEDYVPQLSGLFELVRVAWPQPPQRHPCRLGPGNPDQEAEEQGDEQEPAAVVQDQCWKLLPPVPRLVAQTRSPRACKQSSVDTVSHSRRHNKLHLLALAVGIPWHLALSKVCCR